MLASVSAIGRRGSVGVWGLGFGVLRCGRAGRRRKAEDGQSTSVSCLADTDWWEDGRLRWVQRTEHWRTGVLELLRNADGTVTPTPLVGLADTGNARMGDVHCAPCILCIFKKAAGCNQTKPQTRQAIKLGTVLDSGATQQDASSASRRSRREVMELTGPGPIRLVVTKTWSASLGQAGVLLCAPQACLAWLVRFSAVDRGRVGPDGCPAARPRLRGTVVDPRGPGRQRMATSWTS